MKSENTDTQIASLSCLVEGPLSCHVAGQATMLRVIAPARRFHSHLALCLLQQWISSCDLCVTASLGRLQTLSSYSKLVLGFENRTRSHFFQASGEEIQGKPTIQDEKPQK